MKHQIYKPCSCIEFILTAIQLLLCLNCYDESFQNFRPTTLLWEAELSSFALDYSVFCNRIMCPVIHNDVLVLLSACNITMYP